MIDAQGYEPPEEWDWTDVDPYETKCGGGCGHRHMCGLVDTLWICQWCYRHDQEHDPQGPDIRPTPFTLDQKLDRLEEDNPSIKALADRIDEAVQRVAKGIKR